MAGKHYDTINGFDVFKTIKGYYAKDDIDNCPFIYGDFSTVRDRCLFVGKMKSQFWDAGKYDKRGNQKHNKVGLL